MVSYLRSSDCTIIYEFPHVVSHRVRQVDDMLSVLTKDVELNVQERQVDGQVAGFALLSSNRMNLAVVLLN